LYSILIKDASNGTSILNTTDNDRAGCQLIAQLDQLLAGHRAAEIGCASHPRNVQECQGSKDEVEDGQGRILLVMTTM
jgi:hypothetical protein